VAVLPLTPFDGGSPGHAVARPRSAGVRMAPGPRTAVVYFSHEYRSGVHTWAQRFPDGAPEQSPSASPYRRKGFHFCSHRRLPSSHRSAAGRAPCGSTIRAATGKSHPEGYGFSPVISPDGKKLYYLVRGGGTTSFIARWSLGRGPRLGTAPAPAPGLPDAKLTISRRPGACCLSHRYDKVQAPCGWRPLNGRTAPRRLTDDGEPGKPLRRAQAKSWSRPISFTASTEDRMRFTEADPDVGAHAIWILADGRWIPAAGFRAWGAIVRLPAGGGFCHTDLRRLFATPGSSNRRLPYSELMILTA